MLSVLLLVAGLKISFVIWRVSGLSFNFYQRALFSGKAKWVLFKVQTTWFKPISSCRVQNSVYYNRLDDYSKKEKDKMIYKKVLFSVGYSRFYFSNNNYYYVPGLLIIILEHMIFYSEE